MACITKYVQILLRQDTAANWTANNPVLGSGEMGYETDTGLWKIGDGSTAWTSLKYYGGPFLTAPPGDATKFLNGASTPAWAQVKDSDLNLSDITTNDVSTSKHGFAPKAPNDGSKFLDGTGAWSVPGGAGSSSYFPSFTSPVDGDFSWVNQGSASTDIGSGLGIFLRVPKESGTNWRLRVKSKTSNYTITCGFTAAIAMHGGSGAGQRAGILWRDSSSGKMVVAYIDSVQFQPGLTIEKWTNSSTFSASYVGRGYLSSPTAMFWLQLVDDGSSRIVKYSVDGYNFIQLHTVGRTDFMTADQVGFGAMEQTNSYDMGMLVRSWAES